MIRTRPVLPLLLVGVLAVVGCRRGEDDDAARRPVMDTTNAEVLDGMPAEEMARKAEPISQEEAAARGLIPDTAVTVGDPGSDSIPGRPAAAPPPPPAADTADTTRTPR